MSAKSLLDRVKRMENKLRPHLLIAEGITRIRKIIDSKRDNEFHVCKEIVIEPGQPIKENIVDYWEIQKR